MCECACMCICRYKGYINKISAAKHSTKLGASKGLHWKQAAKPCQEFINKIKRLLKRSQENVFFL